MSARPPLANYNHAAAMDDFVSSGTLSPAYKLRRRTSSDATWKNRRRLLVDDVTVDRRSAIYRLNENNNNSSMAATAGYDAVDRDNGNMPRCSDSASVRCSSTLTLCPGRSAVPTERVVREVKLRADSGFMEGTVEQTTRGVIDAHSNSNNYSLEVIRRGIKLYEAINQTTGGRDFGAMLKSMGPPDPDKMLSFFLDNMAPTIKRVVAFANLLPGFSELDREDRVSLFKQGSFEVIVTRYTRLFTADGMYTPDMTVKIPRHMLPMMPLGDLFSEQYEFADIYNRLELTDAETGLVCAVLLLNPERNGLRNRTAVDKLRQLYLQCLFTYLKKHHPDSYDDLFSRILDLLPLSAALNESHARKMTEIKARMTSPGQDGGAQFNFPDLHNDVFQ